MEKEDEKQKMTCDISYLDACEMLQVYNDSEDDTGYILEHSYLFQFNESVLTEGERLNVVLPLIKWEIDHNDLTEAMSDELYLYYEDLLKGRLDGVIDEEEASLVIGVLTECYIKAFGKDTLDEEDQ